MACIYEGEQMTKSAEAKKSEAEAEHKQYTEKYWYDQTPDEYTNVQLTAIECRGFSRGFNQGYAAKEAEENEALNITVEALIHIKGESHIDSNQYAIASRALRAYREIEAIEKLRGK